MASAPVFVSLEPTRTEQATTWDVAGHCVIERKEDTAEHTLHPIAAMHGIAPWQQRKLVRLPCRWPERAHS